MRKLLSTAALLGSLGTLVCCVLPTAFVALGLGAAFASFVGAFPQVTWLSEQKPLVFGTAAFLIIVAAFAQWRARYTPCPTDPDLARACTSTRLWSRRLLAVAVTLFSLGVGVSFVLPALLALNQ